MRRAVPMLFKNLANGLVKHRIARRLHFYVMCSKNEHMKGVEMNAEQYLKESHKPEDWDGLHENLHDSLYTNNVIEYMEKYAKQFAVHLVENYDTNLIEALNSNISKKIDEIYQYWISAKS